MSPDSRTVTKGDNSVKVTIRSSVSSITDDSEPNERRVIKTIEQSKLKDSQVGKEVSRLAERKISLIDESKFEPDYEESSFEDDNDDEQGKEASNKSNKASEDVKASGDTKRHKHKKNKKKHKHEHKDGKEKKKKKKRSKEIQ